MHVKSIKLAKFEVPGIKEWDFMTVWIFFERIKNSCLENVVGEQDLTLQQHFPKTLHKVSENSDCRINLLFNAKCLKLGFFTISYMLFPFLAFLVIACNIKTLAKGFQTVILLSSYRY